MNPILISENKPVKGERVLVISDRLLIGAKLMQYLSPDDLYWHTDVNTMLPYDTFTHWAEITY